LESGALAPWQDGQSSEESGEEIIKASGSGLKILKCEINGKMRRVGFILPVFAELKQN